MLPLNMVNQDGRDTTTPSLEDDYIQSIYSPKADPQQQSGESLLTRVVEPNDGDTTRDLEERALYMSLKKLTVPNSILVDQRMNDNQNVFIGSKHIGNAVFNENARYQEMRGKPINQGEQRRLASPKKKLSKV